MNNRPATHLWCELPLSATARVRQSYLHGYGDHPDHYDDHVLVVKIVPESAYLRLMDGRMVNALVVATGETANVPDGLGVVMEGWNGSVRNYSQPG